MGIDTKIKSTVNKAVELYKKNEETITKVKNGISTVLTVKDNVKDAFDAAKKVKSSGMKKAMQAMKEEAKAGHLEPTKKWKFMDKLSTSAGIISVVNNVASLPSAFGTAYSDIRAAVKQGSLKNIATATASTLNAGVSTLSTTLDAARLVKTGQQMRSSYKAAALAFKTAMPNATKAMVSAAAKSVMKSSLTGVTKNVAKGSVTTALKSVVEKSGKGLAESLLKTGEKAAAKAAIKSATKEAVKAGLEAGTKAAAGTAGKMLSRFTPGLNIAIAAYDTANCVATLADKNASTGKKVCSVITAAGSILAATNIPVVSQVGAAVSAVSGFISSWF